MSNATDLDRLQLAVIRATHAAGQRLLAAFSPSARPGTRAELLAAIERNEAISLQSLKSDLTECRPGAGWVEEELETRALPPGEWWAVDAVEGNVNHVHGLDEWCVNVTLLRDNVPVLTVVHQPIGNLTYTAVQGGGAKLNGLPLHVSRKAELADAIVATGQAEVGQTNTHARIGHSITALLGKALLVRAECALHLPDLLVAAGHAEAFWQYEPTLPGIAAGVLLVREAGGTVTRLDGTAWLPGSPDIVLAAPSVHTAIVDVLRNT